MGELERKLREDAQVRFRCDVVEAFSVAFSKLQVKYAQGLRVPDDLDVQKITDALAAHNHEFVESLAITAAVERLRATPETRSKALMKVKPHRHQEEEDEI
jgi:hypothetical protein